MGESVQGGRGLGEGGGKKGGTNLHLHSCLPSPWESSLTRKNLLNKNVLHLEQILLFLSRPFLEGLTQGGKQKVTIISSCENCRKILRCTNIL